MYETWYRYAQCEIIYAVMVTKYLIEVSGPGTERQSDMI